MACGVPVVGSDSGEIPNVIGEAGLVFAEGDERALRAKLSQLMTDSALREELAQRGRARVLAHYTQAQVAAKTYQVYCELLGGQRGAEPLLRDQSPAGLHTNDQPEGLRSFSPMASSGLLFAPAD
jgi:hypothetical protein